MNWKQIYWLKIVSANKIGQMTVPRQVQLLIAKSQQATAQKRKLPVRRHTLNINMQKLSIKKKKGRKHGTNCRDRWSRWDYLNRKKNSLNKKYYIKNLKITGFKELRFQLKTLFQGKLLGEELLERLEYVEIKNQMK